jgi:hypothetical protein
MRFAYRRQQETANEVSEKQLARVWVGKPKIEPQLMRSMSERASIGKEGGESLAHNSRAGTGQEISVGRVPASAKGSKLGSDQRHSNDTPNSSRSKPAM